MKELHAGQICLIIGCKYDPINIGKTCTLVEMLPAGFCRYNHPIDGSLQFAETGKSCWIVVGDGICCRKVLSGIQMDGHAIISPNHLMPITGESFDESIKEQLHEPEYA